MVVDKKPEKQYILIYRSSDKSIDLYREFLEKQGFEVLCSADKKKIIELLRQREAAAVITLYESEHHKVIDFLRYIMRQHPHTQRIYITDFLSKDLIQRVINKAHINYLLIYPFELFELKEVVEKAIKRYWFLTQPSRRLNELADITADLLENVDKYRNEAGTDSLTNLLNRRSFDKILEKALSLFYEKDLAFSMILIDLDNFKNLNDTFGHPAGDEVLRVFGQMLRENMRQEDNAFRYGGEEFAILAGGDISQNIKQFINRIRLQIKNKKIIFENQPLQITFSAGMATMRNSFTKEKLVAAADQALYEAKKTGKDRVVDFDELQTAKQK
jgi:diguanylate cyclase (GGDEF)-like protein